MAGRRRAGRTQKRDLVDRWLAHRDEAATTAADPGRDEAESGGGTRPLPVVPSAQPTEPTGAPAPARTGQPTAAAESASTNAEFEPRTANRRLVGEILLVVVLLTALATYFAVTEPTTLTLGLAGVLGVLALVLWGIRAGAPTTRMKVVAGQLVVEQAGKQSIFDLTSHYTPVEVVGRPRDRSWKVLFLRPGADPFVVDASMVDPEHFMQVLRRHRPQ